MPVSYTHLRPTCKLQAIMKKTERLAISMGTSLKRCNVSSPANWTCPYRKCMAWLLAIRSLSWSPKEKHPISVCMGTVCRVRGSEKLPEEFKRILGIEAGETTPDGKFFPDCLWCVGAYGLLPVIMIESLWPTATCGYGEDYWRLEMKCNPFFLLLKSFFLIIKRFLPFMFYLPSLRS